MMMMIMMMLKTMILLVLVVLVAASLETIEYLNRYLSSYFPSGLHCTIVAGVALTVLYSLMVSYHSRMQRLKYPLKPNHFEYFAMSTTLNLNESTVMLFAHCSEHIFRLIHRTFRPIQLPYFHW